MASVRSKAVIVVVAAATAFWGGWRWLDAPERVGDRVTSGLAKGEWSSIWGDGMAKAEFPSGLTAEQFSKAAESLTRNPPVRIVATAPLRAMLQPTTREVPMTIQVGSAAPKPFSITLFRSPRGWVIDDVEILVRLAYATEADADAANRKVAKALLATGAEKIRWQSRRAFTQRDDLLASTRLGSRPERMWHTRIAGQDVE